jgi:hypothetical protein
MSSDPNEAIEKYPLRSLAPVLRKFQPPDGPFDPAGSWEQTYGVYTLAGRAAAARRVGAVRLRRSVGDQQDVALKVEYNKKLTGGSQQVTGELHSRLGSTLSAPVRWSFESKLLDAAGKVIPQTRLRRSAVFRNAAVTITDAKETKTLPIAGAYTVNWSLFDAIQRLRGEKARPLEFTLIDHFDEPKGNQRLSFRKKMDVTVAGGKTLHTVAFDQLGEGNVPWVYWLDERGRLLFIVAGLEAYALESSRQA